MKRLNTINPLIVIVQAMALHVPNWEQYDIVNFFCDQDLSKKEFPTLDELQEQAQVILDAGKAHARTELYRFYGMYREEPQTYDGFTTAWIPANLDADTETEYVEAAAVLTLISDNDGVDVLDNFDFENFELCRNKYLAIGRKVGDAESGNRIVTVEADSERGAVEAFVKWVIEIETKCQPQLKLQASDIICHVRPMKEVQDNLIVASRDPA